MTIPGKQAKLAIPSPAGTFSNGNESTVIGTQKISGGEKKIQNITE